MKPKPRTKTWPCEHIYFSPYFEGWAYNIYAWHTERMPIPKAVMFCEICGAQRPPTKRKK